MFHKLVLLLVFTFFAQNVNSQCDNSNDQDLSSLKQNITQQVFEFLNKSVFPLLSSSGCGCTKPTCTANEFSSNGTCVARKLYGESCPSGKDQECGNGLFCISSICSCAKNEYRSNNECLSKLLLIFTTKNYTTKTINSFNGNLFTAPYQINVIEQPKYYIYVAERDKSYVVMFSEDGTYLKDVSIPEPYGIQPLNDSLYTNGNSPALLYKLDPVILKTKYTSPTLDSNYVKSPFVMRYNPSNGYLYQSDGATRYINVFDLSFNLIKSESFVFSSYGTPIGLNFYQSACLGNLILFVTTNVNLIVVKQSTKTIYKSFNSICPRGYAHDVFVEQKSGYFLISCSFDNIIQLWYINGTDIINTGKTIPTKQYPSGIYVDSNGRLLVSNFSPGMFSILTPYN